MEVGGKRILDKTTSVACSSKTIVVPEAFNQGGGRWPEPGALVI